jgi:hypothetical protein
VSGLPRARRWWWAPLVLVIASVTACSGIPTASAPQVIRTVQRGPASNPPAPAITPLPGEGPNDIVQDFVHAGVLADGGHSTSRQFLTNTAARKWQDNPTVILDETTVGEPAITGDTATVPVTGRRVGMLDAAGIFSPTLKGMGTGDEETFNYVLTRASGQWRIDQLQPGILISQAAFKSAFRPERLYFFDAAERVLVPDLRYSSLEGQALGQWLLDQLLTGPRPELAQSVLNEVPDQVGKPSVQIGDPITVEMPGTAQLDAAGRNGLAAQLAFTLSQVQFAGSQLMLTDSGKTVRVPASQSTEFSEATFDAVSPDSAPSSAVSYFVRDGALYGSDAKPLPGLLGLPARNFVSAAVRSAPSSGAVEVAAVTGTGQLVIGDERKLSPVALPGAVLSRPEWNPYRDDVWVGARGGIYRISGSKPAQLISVTSEVGSPPPGQIVALRFSPDGVRIAVALRGPDSQTTAWVGSVVTSGADVRIDSLVPITPPALSVTDVGWSGPDQLLMIAASPGAGPRVWEVRSDGSELDSQTSVGLTGTPTSIATSPQQATLVAAGGSIWSRTQDTWTPIAGSTTSVPGSNPVYAP